MGNDRRAIAVTTTATTGDAAHRGVRHRRAVRPEHGLHAVRHSSSNGGREGAVFFFFFLFLLSSPKERSGRSSSLSFFLFLSLWQSHFFSLLFSILLSSFSGFSLDLHFLFQNISFHCVFQSDVAFVPLNFIYYSFSLSMQSIFSLGVQNLPIHSS